MKITGQITSLSRDIGGQLLVTLRVDEQNAISDFLEIKDKHLSIDLKEHKNKRSLDANAMLWACLRDIHNRLAETDPKPPTPWDLYLIMLKRYGQFTYLLVKPGAVERMKREWRECEEIGRVRVNGSESVQLICYYGSSTYNSKEMAKLLNGVVEEMRDLNIPLPPSKDIQRAIKAIEDKENEKKERKD